MLKKIALTALAGSLALALAAAEPTKPTQSAPKTQPASSAKSQSSGPSATATAKPAVVKHKRHRVKASEKTSPVKPMTGSSIR